MRIPITIVIALFVAVVPAAAAVHEVGPGHTHEDLDTVPWLDLLPGDEVRIHWRSEPYRTKVGLRVRGTDTEPITIVGVPGPGGERPVLDGDQATTPPTLAGFFDPVWDEYLGVFIVKRGPGDPWGHKPGHLIIDGLHIRGAHPTSTYTAMDGSTQTYADGAAAVWAVLVEDLTIRDCEISGNGNGLFVLSKDAEEDVSRDVLITANHLHDNGVAGSDRHHGIYTQVAGVTFEYNRLGRLLPGAMGSTLKDRSADTVIRYNWIEAAARALDLVDPEDSASILTVHPGFNDTWVYGNLIIDRYSDEHAFATSLVHYGGDTTVYDIYRKGTLHFFHNTVYLDLDADQAWNVQLFDLSTNDESVEIHNNIFYLEGTSNLHLARYHGQHELAASNWINAGWIESRDGFDGTVVVSQAPLTGTDPGIADPANLDFTVPATAAVHDQAAPLPAAVEAQHPVLRQYREHAAGSDRNLEGAAMELGAWETGSGGEIFSDDFETGTTGAWG